jgi:hypothetical protein
VGKEKNIFFQKAKARAKSKKQKAKSKKQKYMMADLGKAMPALSDEIRKRMEAMMAAEQKIRQQVSSVPSSAIRSKTNTAGGMDIEGNMTFYTESGTSKNGKTTPWTVNLEIHNLKHYNSLDLYGKYGPDTVVLADKELEDLPVLDGTGAPYLEPERRHGQLGLAVFVRHKKDQQTGIAYDKTTPYNKRPMSHVTFLREGDNIKCSLFNMTELPRNGSNHPISAGDHIIARGVRAHAYEGSTSWEASVVVATSIIMYEEMWNMLDAELGECKSRNAVQFQKIKEAPLTKAERELEYSIRRKLSQELKTYLHEKIMICKWPTLESNRMAECAKLRQLSFGAARFDESDSSWILTKEVKDKPDVNYMRMWFDQVCTIMDYSNPDAPRTEHVLIEVHISHGASLRFLPIADPTVFPSIAKAHIPHEDLKFMFWGRPHHEDTYNADINNETIKSSALEEVSQKVVISASNSTMIHNNFIWYLIKHGVPLTAEGARLKLVPGSKQGVPQMLDSRFHDQNPFNIVHNGDIYNLNEYKGLLDAFYADFSFFTLFSRALLPFQVEEIQGISTDPTVRAEVCTDILLGRPCKNPIIATKLQFDKNGIFVIFAVRRTLVERMEADAEKYSFARYEAAVERAHCEHDPGAIVTSEASSSLKRKIAEEGTTGAGNNENEVEAKRNRSE